MIKNALVVDDDLHIKILVAEFLRDQWGIDTETAISANDAIKILTQKSFDLIISDYHMEDGTGMDLFLYLKAQLKTLPFFVMHTSDSLLRDNLNDADFPIMEKMNFNQLELILKESGLNGVKKGVGG